MAYGALVGPGSNFAGVDQGIDFTPSGAGFDMYAPAPGTITVADATGHHYNRTSGTALIILKLDQPPGIPNSSQFIYYAELIDPNPAMKVGMHVDKGFVIGHNSQSPGVEIGWGSSATQGFMCESGIPTPCGQSFDNWVQGLAPGGTGGSSGGGGGGVKCDGCGFKGIGLHTQGLVDSVPGASTVSPDLPDICVLTGCQEKALKAGLITFGGALIMGLGVFLIAHWGMHNTKAGQAVGRSANKAMGLVGILGGPEAFAATETLSHLTRSRQQPAQTQPRPRTQPTTRTAGQLPGEQPGAYEEYQATGGQPNGDTPSHEQTPDQYLERMGA